MEATTVMNRLTSTIVLVIITVGLTVTACDGNGSDTRTEAYRGDLLLDQKRVIADQIVSVFENNTPIIQYAYAKKLYDGRGITAGRAGFTSATGDMLAVIERYSAKVPVNYLAAYLPALRELSTNRDGSTDQLNQLENSWRDSAQDPAFRQAQDEIVDEYYFIPAMRHAERLGISQPLTLLNLYDAIIQHGNGNRLDLDGLPAMIERATSDAGGAPNDGVSESAWLQSFMRIRRAVLLNPDNDSTQQVWSESVARVDTLLELFNANNFSLSPPIVIDTWGKRHIIPLE